MKRTTSTDVSAVTAAGFAGSSTALVAPGKFLSCHVLTSPMPSSTFAWQLKAMGSFQSVTTGNPSAASKRSAWLVPRLFEYSGTGPWFFR